MGRSLILRMILALLMWGAGARAAETPAEAPGPDFPGRQYVDSTGCVFLRSGDGRWQARTDADGAPVCGYPPTPRSRDDGRRLLPAAPDPALAMPGMGQAEARLLAAVASQMQPGDFIGAAVPAPGTAAMLSAAPANSDPTAPASGPMASADGPALPLDQKIAAAVALSPVLAGVAAGDLHPERRLCALLGAPSRAGAPPPPLAADASQGFCGATGASLPDFSYGEGTAALVRIAPDVQLAKAAPVAIAAAQRRRPPGGVAARASAAVKVATRGARRAPAAPRHPVTRQAVIPPWARWLEVGRFANPAEADAALRRLAAAGFQVGRIDAPPGGAQAVLAGPYASRQAIVTARDRLLRAGFHAPVPR